MPGTFITADVMRYRWASALDSQTELAGMRINQEAGGETGGKVFSLQRLP
jgi:hypothetical protein